MITIYVEGCKPIQIGHVRDNVAARVAFPVSQTLATFGEGGRFDILYRRPTESTAYPTPEAQLEIADGFLYWTITSTEVAYYGLGAVQLSYTLNDVVKMSFCWDVQVFSSLIAGGNAPSYIESWLNELHDIKDEAVKAAEGVQNMTVSAHEAEEVSVTKTVDPETGVVNLDFGLSSGGDLSEYLKKDEAEETYVPKTAEDNRIEGGGGNSALVLGIGAMLSSADTAVIQGEFGVDIITGEGNEARVNGSRIFTTADGKTVYVAVYDVTTFEEIREASTSGLPCVCLYPTNGRYATYPLANCTGSSAQFYIPFYSDQLNYAQLRKLNVTAGGWSYENVRVELNANKVTTVTSASDNVHFPTAKAVWNAIQGAAGGALYEHAAHVQFLDTTSYDATHELYIYVLTPNDTPLTISTIAHYWKYGEVRHVNNADGQNIIKIDYVSAGLTEIGGYAADGNGAVNYYIIDGRNYEITVTDHVQRYQ